MSIAASLARQRAIFDYNNAQMAAIRASQAQQDLIGSKGSLESIARKDAFLEMEKEKAATKAKVARARKDALKNASKRNKVDYMA